jgi:uncharacterized membrane-anchored protein
MRRALRLATILFFSPALAWAQEAAPAGEVGEAADAQEAAEGEGPSLPWQAGPILAPIGNDIAEIDLPEGYLFLDREGTLELLRLTGNLTGEAELAAIAKQGDSGWFVIFEWDGSGWVDDSDRDELDGDALLASLRENDQRANEERRRLGLPELELVGWHEAPHYDASTNNLTWATRLRSADGETVNRLVKLLGRRGVMSATLVAGPEELAEAQADVDGLLTAYRFRPGSTYAEYLPGTDTAAGYGLGALVVGGVLAKTGVLAKFWKLIVAGVMAAVAGISRLFKGRSAPAA